MAGLEPFRVQAEAVGGARGQVLHEDVGAGEEFLQDLPALGRLEVEADRLLGAVEPDEVTGLAVDSRVVPPGEVAAAGALDLDHPRAQVGQLPGRVRRRHRLLDADHRHTGEGRGSGEGMADSWRARRGEGHRTRAPRGTRRGAGATGAGVSSRGPPRPWRR